MTQLLVSETDALHKYWEEGCIAAENGETVDANPYAGVDEEKSRVWLAGHAYCSSPRET